MGRFVHLCRSLEDSRPPNERLDQPIKDWTQTAWERTIGAFHNQGRPIENAETAEELARLFEQDAGLVVTCYQREVASFYRSYFANGLSDHEQRLIARVFSLDSTNDDGDSYAEIIEDVGAELPFRFAECYDLVINDPRLTHLSTEQKNALKRFILAWGMQQSGYPITRQMSMRLSRDRKMTGLPLVLEQGRNKGGKKNNAT